MKAFGIAWEKNVQNVIFHCTYFLTQHYVFIYFNVESSDIFKFWHKFVNDRPLPQSSEWMQVWTCLGNLAARLESKYRYLWAKVNLSLIFRTIQARGSIFYHKVQQKWKSACIEMKILQYLSEFEQHVNSSCLDYFITKVFDRSISMAFIRDAQIIDGLFCSHAWGWHGVLRQRSKDRTLKGKGRLLVCLLC